ncbi:MAG: hypothetical protein ABIP44_00795 [Pseudoxanthomonas sp.]
MEKNVASRPAIGAGLILLAPLVMSMIDRRKPDGDGWHWSPPDFFLMGALLFGAGLTYELLSRKLGANSHRWALGLVIVGVVLAIWSELAVDGVSQSLSYLFG